MNEIISIVRDFTTEDEDISDDSASELDLGVFSNYIPSNYDYLNNINTYIDSDNSFMYPKLVYDILVNILFDKLISIIESDDNQTLKNKFIKAYLNTVIRINDINNNSNDEITEIINIKKAKQNAQRLKYFSGQSNEKKQLHSLLEAPI